MNLAKQLPSQEELRKYFEYRDGGLYWKVSLNARGKTGSRAGYTDPLGYRHIKFKKTRFSEHRLVWVYFNGDLNRNLEIDHIDRNPANNHIENLRPTTHYENHWNKGLNSRNTSGHRGVIWYKQTRRWSVSITRNHEHIWVGYFKKLDDAVKARQLAEATYQVITSK